MALSSTTFLTRRKRRYRVIPALTLLSTLMVVLGVLALNFLYIHQPLEIQNVVWEQGFRKRTTAAVTHSIPRLSMKPNCSNIEGEGGLQVLQKVREGLQESRALLRNRVAPKIFCMVYTVDQPGSRSNLEAAVQTWGRQCDGFLAASNVTDDLSTHVPHSGPEAYENMWQKVRGMWEYVVKHYVDNFDYFHICGDDTYVVVDNLRAYLLSDQIASKLHGELDIFARHQMKKHNLETEVRRSSETHPRPLLLGMPQLFRQRIFPSGGPGYTLNRAAVRLWKESILSHMFVNLTDSREDVFTGDAFRSLGVIVSDTRDKAGAWRYNIENADTMSRFHFKPLKQIGNDLHLVGTDGVSKQSVAFHAKVLPDRLRGKVKEPFPPADLMRRYHSILEGLCDS